jgi:hypothetical protein
VPPVNFVPFTVTMSPALPDVGVKPITTGAAKGGAATGGGPLQVAAASSNEPPVHPAPTCYRLALSVLASMQYVVRCGG